MKWFPYAFCSIFIFAGMVIAVYGMVAVVRAGRTSSWLTTDGLVTTSQVVLRGEGYAPAVIYSYAVDGKTYHGTEIEFASDLVNNDGNNAAARAGRYPVGSKVKVYFDPEIPDHAVLEPGISKRAFLPLVFGIGFASAGAWFCLMFWLFSD